MIILTVLLYVLWFFIDHSLLTNVPLETRHFLFAAVGTVFTVFIAYLAASTINRQYKRLRELEKVRENLTHMIVHDLRTPLTSMIGSLGTMKSGTLGELNPEMSEFIDMSIDGAEDLLAMVNDLLDISKMEYGVIELSIQRIDLGTLVSSAMQNVSHLALDKNIYMKMDENLNGLTIDCDEEKIRRVLINLLGNAIKYTPSGGSVTVDASRDHTGTTIKVIDTGVGIPEEFHETIFEKFGQVDRWQSGQKMSTGLGLTFCKLALEAHQGRIWIESVPNNGSIFQFFLPRHIPAKT